MFSKITFLKSVRSKEKDEASHSFLENIFTKSVHRRGVYYLQKVMPSFSDFKYLQKVSAQCPYISDKKVLPLWQITFDPLKLGSKAIYQSGKTCIFHQNSEGILHSLFAGT